MPDLNFEVTAVESARRSLTPLLQFKLRIKNPQPDEAIQSVLLAAQIQIQAPQRTYSSGEKEKLMDLFGSPEDWSRTLRNQLWTQVSLNIGAFKEGTEALLPVVCSADLSLAAAKYFNALEGGEVSLLFLFSGTVFYTVASRLQVSPISWNKEAEFRMPATLWQAMLQEHYPNTSWLSMERDVFEKLHAHKRTHGFLSWEETIVHLLQMAEGCGAPKAQPQVMV